MKIKLDPNPILAICFILFCILLVLIISDISIERVLDKQLAELEAHSKATQYMLNTINNTLIGETSRD